MSNLPAGCGLAQFEEMSPSGVETESNVPVLMKGTLLDVVSGICEKCIELKIKSGETLCHPLIYTRQPEVPLPFIIQLEV